MKRWSWVLLVVLFVIFLVQPPAYWKLFRKDSKEYKADTFYYIIKEEYRDNNLGKRWYQPAFTDIQDGDILVTDSTYCLCFRQTI